MTKIHIDTFLLIVCLEEKPKALMTQQPDVDMVYTGEPVSFECKVKISSGWDYHWFKNGSAVLNYVSRFYIHNATVMDAGKYTCIATRNKTKYNTEKSDERLLRVSGELKKVTMYIYVVI